MIKTDIRTELSSGNILIRRARLEDKEQLHQAVKDSMDDLTAWMPWAHTKYSRNDAEDFLVTNVLNWEEGQEYNFLVFDKSTYRLLGGCGLNKIDLPNKVANLGYWIRSSEMGKGFATKATLLTALFAFEDLKLNRLEILVSVDNYPSLKVAKKVGAHWEGVLKKRILLKNKAHDAVISCILNTDLKDIKLKLNRF